MEDATASTEKNASGKPHPSASHQQGQGKAERVEMQLIEKRLNCQAELKMKLLLVGSSMVGKTSLISRLANSGANIDCLKPTMAADFHHCAITLGGKCAHVRIWDMAGAEQFHQSNLLSDFYRDIDGVLLVFAIDNFESFMQLPQWLERIRRHQSRPLEQLDCCLVANKSDLANNRVVSAREADAFARHRGMSYIEASALTVDNVQKAFYDLVMAVDRRRQTEQREQLIACKKRPAAAGGASGGCIDAMTLCCGCGGRGSGDRG